MIVVDRHWLVQPVLLAAELLPSGTTEAGNRCRGGAHLEK